MCIHKSQIHKTVSLCHSQSSLFLKREERESGVSCAEGPLTVRPSSSLFQHIRTLPLTGAVAFIIFYTFPGLSSCSLRLLEACSGDQRSSEEQTNTDELMRADAATTARQHTQCGQSIFKRL